MGSLGAISTSGPGSWLEASTTGSGSPRGALVSHHARRGSARNPACFSLVSSSYLLTPDSSRQTSPRRYEKRYEKPSVGNLHSNCLTSPLLRRLPVGSARAGCTLLDMNWSARYFIVSNAVMLFALCLTNVSRSLRKALRESFLERRGKHDASDANLFVRRLRTKRCAR